MTDLATFVPATGGPDAPGPAIVVSPGGFYELVSSLLGGLGFDAMGPVERSEWLRIFTNVDGAVAASRSRALSVTQGVRPRRFLERSAELVHTTGMSTFDARQAVNLADTLDEMPAAADALATGGITTGHAAVLARGVSDLNRPAAAADPSLLAAARSQGVDDFKASMATWKSEIDGDLDGSRLASRQHRDRKVTWYTKTNGMIHIDADLAPDVGSIVTGVIRGHAEHLWRTEDGRTADPDGPFGTNGRHTTRPDRWSDSEPDTRRTTRQRNADALAAIARHFNNPDTTSPSPRAGQTRSDVIVTIDYDKLTTSLTSGGGGNGLCATTDGVTLAPATIRRIACDAGIIPILLSSTGDVLDIGRRTRTITTPLRNALTIRDRGCTFPGCHQPPSMCDAHHLQHWSDGGPTNLANLTLLCSTHHHVIHEGRWHTTRNPDGHLTYRSPTGQPPTSQRLETRTHHQDTATRRRTTTRDTPDDPDPP